MDERNTGSFHLTGAGQSGGVSGSEARRALPRPGSPEASAMMDSLLAEYQFPANPKNAARAGWEAANRWLRQRPGALPALSMCPACFAECDPSQRPGVQAASEPTRAERPVKLPGVEVALNMCREANIEVTLTAPMCWDLALYVARLESALAERSAAPTPPVGDRKPNVPDPAPSLEGVRNA